MGKCCETMHQVQEGNHGGRVLLQTVRKVNNVTRIYVARFEDRYHSYTILYCRHNIIIGRRFSDITEADIPQYLFTQMISYRCFHQRTRVESLDLQNQASAVETEDERTKILEREAKKTRHYQDWVKRKESEEKATTRSHARRAKDRVQAAKQRTAEAMKEEEHLTRQFEDQAQQHSEQIQQHIHLAELRIRELELQGHHKVMLRIEGPGISFDLRGDSIEDLEKLMEIGKCHHAIEHLKHNA